jgi:hypothetical protein
MKKDTVGVEELIWAKQTMGEMKSCIPYQISFEVRE